MRPIIILICVDFVYRIVHRHESAVLSEHSLSIVQCVASITTFRTYEGDIMCTQNGAMISSSSSSFLNHRFTRFTSHFIVLHCIPLAKRAMQTEKNKREKEGERERQSETSDRREASYQLERERENEKRTTRR
jgi:hypothetical protein